MPVESLIPVALGERSYDILIGQGLLAEAGPLIAPVLPQPRAIIVTDRTVAGHHLEPLQSALSAQGVAAPAVIIPPGEGSKDFASLAQLMGQILDLRPDRKTALIALGGGVVGDLTGFAASILLRGVPFVQVPTTLLSQVDSSVGGKTGINMPQGKNLVGAFHQPLRVLIDTATLATLPVRELKAGLAEVVKYGLIDDPAFFGWLEEHLPAVLSRAPEALTHAIGQSCRNKARIVALDETETGPRALLNLGHTFGHALEKLAGFSDTLLHGEAVAIGCAMAYGFSAAEGLCPAEDAGRAIALIRHAGLPVHPAQCGLHAEAAAMVPLMYQDKKAEGGRLRFILTRGLGRGFIEDGVDPARLAAFLEAYLSHER